MSEPIIETPIEEPVEDPRIDPVEEPTEDPVEPTGDDPVEEPTQDPVEDPVEEPTEDPINPDDIEIETRGKADVAPIDYGEDIDPEDAKTIGAIVEKQREQDRKELQTIKDEIEVNGFLQGKPEFAKYKPAIMKYLAHPAYSNIPVKNIAAMVASNDLMKLGAKKERQAQATVAATKTKGTPARKPVGAKTDWSTAPKEAVEEQIRKIKTGRA